MQNSYGKRRGQEAVNTGIRPIAPTYGRASFLSYSHRSGYTHATESANERLVSQMLDIDPSFKSHQAQPFTVDVLEQRLIHARAERNKLSATRKKTSEMRRATPCTHLTFWRPAVVRLYSSWKSNSRAGKATKSTQISSL